MPLRMSNARRSCRSYISAGLAATCGGFSCMERTAGQGTAYGRYAFPSGQTCRACHRLPAGFAGRMVLHGRRATFLGGGAGGKRAAADGLLSYANGWGFAGRQYVAQPAISGCPGSRPSGYGLLLPATSRTAEQGRCCAGSVERVPGCGSLRAGDSRWCASGPRKHSACRSSIRAAIANSALRVALLIAPQLHACSWIVTGLLGPDCGSRVGCRG
jgi:hypothetical protein